MIRVSNLPYLTSKYPIANDQCSRSIELERFVSSNLAHHGTYPLFGRTFLG